MVSDQPDNLVTVDFAAERPIATVKRRRHHKCKHGYTEIDEVLRRVTCRTCDEVLDPVQVLLDLAVDWERVATTLATARRAIERKHKQLENVDRELTNAKARLRRANKGR